MAGEKLSLVPFSIIKRGDEERFQVFPQLFHSSFPRRRADESTQQYEGEVLVMSILPKILQNLKQETDTS